MIRIASILVLALLPNVADSVTCYGDVRRLSPKGASSDTARQDRLSYTGPAASRKILENDYRDLNRMKSCYDRVGRKYCIQPSVIAALASRESRGGRIIQSSNGWGDCKNGRCRAYGILQCDIYSSGLGNRCTQYGWKSCEHIDMMVKDVLLSKIKGVQRKQTSWSKERQLQGGIAAYNFGVSNVQSWERLDKGSTGDDYSGDVVARAKHLIDKYGWQ